MSQTPEDTQDFLTEFIAEPPRALVRWGIGAIMGFVLLIVLFSWHIDYADTINTTVLITSNQPATIELADHDVVIDQIMVSDGQQVSAGQVIMRLDSEVRPETMTALQHLLRQDTIRVTELQPFFHQHLGLLRADFQSLAEALYAIDQQQNEAQLSIAMAQQQSKLATARQRLTTLDHRLSLVEQKFHLEQASHRRSGELQKDGLLSRKEVETLHKQGLETQILMKQLNDDRLLVNQQITEAEQQLQWLKNDHSQNLSMARLQQQLAQQKLLDLIQGWEHQHILRASHAGIMALPNGRADRQNIRAGEHLFTVIPGSSELRGQVSVPEQGTGKVSPGQAVLMRLMRYPAAEFGEITGQVINVSPSVHEQRLNLEISIDGYDPATNQITTSYGQQVQYLPHMEGHAEIITQKNNLLSRIFAQLIILF